MLFKYKYQKCYVNIFQQQQHSWNSSLTMYPWLPEGAWSIIVLETQEKLNSLTHLMCLFLN